MNYQNLHIILSFIAFALVVLSSPIVNEEDSGYESDEGIDLPDIAYTTDNKTTEDPNYPKNINNNSTSEEICDTQECQIKAKSILSSLNLDVNPCDDFYEFACGNFIKEDDISDALFAGSLEKTTYENTQIIKKRFEEGYKANENLTPEEQEYDKKNFEKVVNFYNSCMDNKTLNAKGIKPILDLFDKLKIEENRTKYNNPEDLTDFLIQLSKFDINLFFTGDLFQNLNDSKTLSTYIGQPGVGLENINSYEDQEIVSKYKNIMKFMFTKVFENQKERNIEKMIETVFEFEKKLSNIITNYGQDLKGSLAESYAALLISIPYHVEMTIKSLNESYPYINWESYFNKKFKDLGYEKTFNDDSIIINITSEYFEKLNDLLKETNSDTIADYAEWSIIRKYSIYLGSDINEMFGDYYNVLFDQNSFRDAFCISLFADKLSMSVSKIFVDQVFGENDKKNIEIMIENIRESMNRRISELSWLDKETKEKANKKASSLIHEIGYPDFIMNPKELYDYYETLEIDPNDLLNNIINGRRFEIIDDFKSIESGRIKWLMPSFVANAYYNPTRNMYVFPAGILQKPLYSSSYPNYINYGSTGSTIGHELSHAFDNSGRLFDYEGRLNDWWTESTENEFNTLSQCFIDQYSQYYITDGKGVKHHIDGELTLGENIADNGGLSRGYEAWKLSLENDPEAKEKNKNLPGLSQFTHDQLFFIAYGQNSCGKSPIQKQILNLNDEHPPEKFRVLGPISNSEYFAKVFNCPTNSKMNPEKKCKIW